MVPRQRVCEESSDRVLSKMRDFSQRNMAIFLRSVENDLLVLGRLCDFLIFGHRGAPVCCYRIPSYLISSKYHQTVVNINLRQANTLVIEEIQRFTSPSISVV